MWLMASSANVTVWENFWIGKGFDVEVKSMYTWVSPLPKNKIISFLSHCNITQFKSLFKRCSNAKI